MTENDSYLERFAQNLYHYPLPPKTEILRQDARVGLEGNGNHCDFIVEETLVTKLTRQEIERYYRDVKFPSAKKETDKILEDQVGVHVSFENSSAITELTFTLTLADVGYNPKFDWRCY